MRRVAFGIILVSLALAAGCGGGGSASSKVPATVTLTPSVGRSINAGSTLTINAAASDGSLVTWTVSGAGTLANATQLPNQPPNVATYLAPSFTGQNAYAVVTATTASGASAYLPLTVVPFNVFGNVQGVSVDGGPSSHSYPNAAFTSVDVCTTGSTNCKTINGILVDTGTVGLRILASALPTLTPVKDSSGDILNECFQFEDQSYIWGQVELADVRINGEIAASLPIQAIADPSGYSIPSDCAATGTEGDKDSLDALGANGILGIGVEPQDCGAACVAAAGATPPGAAYYTCTGGSCTAAFASLAQQVNHPATFFGIDNNGTVLQLPSVSGSAGNLTGFLTFGVGTQSNNQIGTQTIFTLDANDNFTVKLSETGQTLTSSFLDSGSNAFFFPDDAITTCASPYALFFCPAAPISLTVTSIGVNKSQDTNYFTIDNASDLLTNNPGDVAFSGLGGPNGTGLCSDGTGACSFIFGVPFFYGRTIFTTVRGQSPPINTPAAPWWAYTTSFPAP